MNLMKKKLNKKGFTLAELLIVVAIIAVLAAIAIPVFSSQLTKAKVATDISNLRAAKAAAQVAYLTDNAAIAKTGFYTDGTLVSGTSKVQVTMKADSTDATGDATNTLAGLLQGATYDADDPLYVTVDANGNITFSFS